jgi:hypothetical protein
VKPFKLLQEWVMCPLDRKKVQLCQVGFMGDFRFKRKRCASCLLVVDSKNWKRLERLDESRGQGQGYHYSEDGITWVSV